MTRFGVTENVHAWHSLDVRHNMSATNVSINAVADFSIFFYDSSQFLYMHCPYNSINVIISALCLELELLPARR